MSDPSLSRRQLLKGVAAAMAAIPLGKRSAAALNAPAAREKLSPFRYSQVRLTGGPLKAQFERIHAYYLGLDEDALLKELRVRAGLPAPGEYLGGWYDRDGFAPGHSFGQYVSALARFADATGDPATQAKTRRLVEGFAATIAPDGFCYPSQKAATDFPAYNYDKYVVGLLDAYRFAGISSALPTLDRATRGALKYMPPRALDRNLEPHDQGRDDESYTLGENCFYAYEVTGNPEYLEMARRYLLDRTYFNPLSRGENVLPGRHAYSHCNALSSAARAYLNLGESKYFDAIRNAWDMIEQTQAFASGGWGPNEMFVEPGSGKLGSSLFSTHAHFETPCGAYAHFKLARYLLRFTAEARYGDGLERVLYNTVLGAQDPSGEGHFFYYSDYSPSARKGYHPEKWPCCSGTLPQVVADYLISIYFRRADDLYVNLFVPSEVSWKAAAMPAKLIQNTGYPETESTELRLELPAAAEFTVYVRIPGWLQSPAVLSVNGKAVSTAAERGTFAALRRRWHNNDTIQVELPFSFRKEAVDAKHPNVIAVMRGPLMLVAEDAGLKLEKGSITGPQGLQRASSGAQTFEESLPSRTLRFAPFYRVREESYTTYIEL